MAAFSDHVLDAEQPTPRRRWLRQGLLALVILVLASVGDALFTKYLQQTAIGESVRYLQYATQVRARSDAIRPNDQRLPVVIDISPTRSDRTKPTDRQMLSDLVDSLRSMRAAAIGLDIDFSPEVPGQFVDPRDLRLLLKWSEYGNVRVGIFRRIGDSSEHWLARGEFRHLAAGIMLPANDPIYGFQYSSPDVSTSDEAPPLIGSRADNPDEQLLQMPTALYEVLHAGSRLRLVTDPNIKPITDETGRLRLGQYPIDYSYVPHVRTIRYREKSDLARYEEEIEYRTVLIGDAFDAQDSRAIPVEGSPVSGVMVHAAAFATMNHGLLHYIGEEEGFVIEVVLGVLICVVTGLVHTANASRTRSRRFSIHAVEIFASTAAGLAVLIVCTSWFSVSRIFWPDYLWVAVALFFHPYLEYLKRMVVRPGLRGAVQHAESA